MPVGIELRVPELRSDALFKTLGDEVFQPLGLVMDLLDRKIQDLVEECLDQAMVAQDFKRAPFASGDSRTPRCFSYSTKGGGEDASFCSMLVIDAGATPSLSARACSKRAALPARPEQKWPSGSCPRIRY